MKQLKQDLPSWINMDVFVPRLDEPGCVCSKAHKTHRAGAPLCFQGEMLDLGF